MLSIDHLNSSTEMLGQVYSYSWICIYLSARSWSKSRVISYSSSVWAHPGTKVRRKKVGMQKWEAEMKIILEDYISQYRD